MQTLWAKIRVLESEKDIGVIINSNMKFSDQIKSVTKRANNTSGMIERNFEYINKDVAILFP